MTEEEYEARAKELEKEIQEQTHKVYEARMALYHEAKKLINLQRELKWLPAELQGDEV